MDCHPGSNSSSQSSSRTRGRGAASFRVSGPFNVCFEGSDGWDDGGPSGPYRRPTTHVEPIVFPVPYQAGDADAGFLIVNVTSGAKDAKAFAAALRDLRSIRVEVSWSFQRSAGLLRRRRELRSHTVDITVDPGLWRAKLIKSWQMGPGGLSGHQAPLAEIAGGIRRHPPLEPELRRADS
jgi:hypothetical protein